jgi:hypothetical protein
MPGIPARAGLDVIRVWSGSSHTCDKDEWYDENPLAGRGRFSAPQATPLASKS